MANDATMRDYVDSELDQREQTGHDVEELRAEARRTDLDTTALADLLERIEAAPRGEFRYVEPDELDDILAETDAHETDGTTPQRAALPEAFSDRMLAAWRGRVAGNMLGKPVEQGEYWTRARLREYLVAADAYPLTDYVPAPDGLRQQYELRPDNWDMTTRGRVDGSCRDDDVDYTVLGLHLLEKYGLDFTTEDVAEEWQLRLPYHQTYTAERAAYRNLIEEIPPSQAARHRNPYREWIGALIRADIFGYVNPGRPDLAVRQAYRDARLSHTGNGIYGEQWAAALTAAALVADDVREAYDRARRYVPRQSRTAEAIDAVTACYERGGTWEEALEDADRRWHGYHWVHTVNNAAVIAAALLWGEGDFTRSIALTVQGGLDTDSNGATVGSVVGAVVGTGGIPAHWTDPLRDTVRSAVFGFDGVTISDLARRTESLATARGSS
ncbi:ADP-ribosylglycohydrolase family protein [Georgenia halophila]|uniref:ADP-ribosylglycohydrolase family protein n=1 Tax=Georgenia halophila TaxID=620889 RepID=A0ABP8LKX1_9MICO